MKSLLKISLFAITVVIIGCSYLWFVPPLLEKQFNHVEAHPAWPVSAKAQALHDTLTVGDWHSDALLWRRSLNQQSDYGHVDVPRLQTGNVAIQMFTTVTKSPEGQNYEKNSSDAGDNITLLALAQAWPPRTWNSLSERALYQAGRLHEFAAEAPEQLKVVTTATELKWVLQQRAEGKKIVAGLIGTEGSHALDGKLENVQRLYDAGFRMMSLQHFFDNKLGGSLHGTSGAGLSEFGQQVVKRINQLNIVLDVSHSSEQVVKDVLALSDSPIVVSHTGLQGHCDSARNISDSLMQAIATKGGLIALGYWDGAMCEITPKNIAAAIVYGIELVGAEHISLGSDFDGSVSTVFDTSELAAITHELVEAGVSDDNIRKVMGANMVNFLLTQLPQG